MPHFTKQIQTTLGLKTFHFNRIFTVNGTKYHLSVTEHATSYYFLMEERNGSWLIAETIELPLWIRQADKELEKAIWEHLNN